MLPNEMEPLVLHPPVPLAQVAPQPTATTPAIPMLPVLSTMAMDQEVRAIPTSTNTTTNVTATTTATTEPPATTIRARPSIQRLEQILNNLPLTSQQQTAGRQDIVQNAAEDTTPTVPGKGKGRVTRTSPELDSDDEFWKEAMGKTLENTDSKDTPTIQSGSRSSITPIPEEVSADSEVSDTETGARKHSRKSSDSEEDTIANSPLNDPFFPPPPPPVHVRVSLHHVSLHCDNVEPDHASEVSPTTMARLLQGNSRIPRIVAPGQVRTTGMPSFTRLGNQNTSMCPPTPQPQQRNIDPNAAEALACLDRMNHFTPLAPCPGSSSEAALTLTPPNGFPRIHADHPFWYLEDMQGEQSCQWCSLFGTALAVVPYSFSANDLAFRAAVLAIVPRVVTQHFNVQNPHLAPPLALTDIRRTNQLPFAYLLYNLTPAEYEALLCQYCISTADLTFFIYDLSGEIPHYIRTLSSFMSSDSTELRDIIIARLCENASIQILIDILGGDEHAVAIYAPNGTSDNENFWIDLRAAWEHAHLHRPDILLRDFNLVEDALDRLPCHSDPTTAVSALTDLCLHFNLQDGWRSTFPDTHTFSFLQPSSRSQSRIDHIYASPYLTASATDWQISPTAVPTNHQMVSVRIVDQKSPHIGKGRWTLPLFLIHDSKFAKEVNFLGRKLQQDIQNCIPTRSPDRNPQTLFALFKKAVISAARKRAKSATPTLQSKITSLREQLNATLNSANIQTDPALQLSAALLQQRITDLERDCLKKVNLTTAARHRLEAETPSKYWSNLSKQQKPHDVIFSLRSPTSDPPEYVTCSDQMATLARNYHNDLQSEQLPSSHSEREKAITNALKATSEQLSDMDNHQLAKTLTANQIEEALRLSENGRAAGLNGLPYKLWKALQARFTARSADGIPTFDIITTLTTVYNDIQTHSVSPNTDFAAGWLCPLYKKKDRRDIANYRPITLLNTDYKILMKALSLSLSSVVRSLIHPDQAGFVPGCNILDQVQLSKTLIDYGEALEENGVIVALDQEKAYDKVTHDYLWRILDHMNIPPSFVNTIRSLYENAETVVIINGECSSPFKVTRGVRQGDPLSCLIFNLAIEPLACLLRNSLGRDIVV
ncbi:hypothetical protein SCP_0203160 [Sparassis crispa]|uniref:Reverse transcriptase domain-containing protein n=1 Tax=Sparassis crispa TaxID=139825 RepID=A0A401GAE6_9APHY|nr:hypothetical protein SCP_0203160 [Sparassis crispa]GBE79119.1 hypothetical protein SCP_0203160 [Sparassis crispa]